MVTGKVRRPHTATCAYQTYDSYRDCCTVAVAFDATMAERERAAKIAVEHGAPDVAACINGEEKECVWPGCPTKIQEAS